MSRKLKPAVAYLRTSSATNVGADKDSDKRQRAAIEAFAKRAGFTIIAEYYDKAVSGADRIAPYQLAATRHHCLGSLGRGGAYLFSFEQGR